MRLSLALPLLLFLPAPASAARLLNFSVELNGQKVLAAIDSDDGLADPGTIWSRLHQKMLTAENGPQFPIKVDDPLHCQLEGNIVIRATHAGKVLAEAKVSELQLVRTDAASNLWSLSPDAVVRTAQAAGLKALPTGEKGIEPRLLVLIGLSGVVLLIGIWVMARHGTPMGETHSSRNPSGTSQQ
jgi:hypothetical protein